MKWISSFRYIHIGYGEHVVRMSDTTQRVAFYNNVLGGKVRLRLTNRYSVMPLVIDGISVSVLRDGSAKDSAVITLNGKNRIELSPGEETFSDEAVLDVKPGDELLVNMYFKGETLSDGICCYWSKMGAKVTHLAGNCLSEKEGVLKEPELLPDFMKEDPNTPNMSFFIGFDTLQVLSDEDIKVIAAFGDSITHMSYYTSALEKRLRREYPGRAVLLNCGIGGNRLVDDATFVKEAGRQLVFFGEAGVSRFERDVFSLDEVDAVLVLIGINDIMHPMQLEGKEKATSPDRITEGYKKLINMAHENGAEIYFCTVTPCGNSDYPDEWLREFEASRQGVNSWILGPEAGDGAFDFDKAIADPKRPGFIRESYHLGDGLHPSDEGGAVLAYALDLRTVVGR